MKSVCEEWGCSSYVMCDVINRRAPVFCTDGTSQVFSHEPVAWYDTQPRNVLIITGSTRLASLSYIRGLIQVVTEKSLCVSLKKKKKKNEVNGRILYTSVF